MFCQGGIFMPKSKDNREKRICIRITGEEDVLLNQLAQKRGVTKSEYIREKALNSEDTYIYNKDVGEAIYNMCNLMVHELPQYCTNKEFINKCERGVEQLWLFLK